MNKIRIIDLLNKIANGEKLPFLIKYEDIILKYDLEGQDYRIYQNGYLFANLFEREDCKFLNDEVEIPEEEKKIPEKLNEFIHVDSLDYRTCNRMFETLTNKYNEIIDYLKIKGE